MNDLPQRPKFYLHRSRRFWGGLVVLIFLFGLWHMAQRKSLELALTQRKAITPGYEDVCDYLTLSQRSGSFIFRYRHDEFGNLGVKPPTSWDLEMDQSGADPVAKVWPSGKFQMSAIDFEFEFSLPIWILLLFWAILWPLWIRRGDKLEEKRFRTK